MSKKENLLKFWESLESNQKCQSSQQRRDSSIIPQKLVLDKNLTQKLPRCLEKRLTGSDHSEKKEQGSSSPETHPNTEDNQLPHLPRYSLYTSD